MGKSNRGLGKKTKNTHAPLGRSWMEGLGNSSRTSEFVPLAASTRLIAVLIKPKKGVVQTVVAEVGALKKKRLYSCVFPERPAPETGSILPAKRALCTTLLLWVWSANYSPYSDI